MAYTHLTSGGANFSDLMLKNKFGVVTVMNVKVYNYDSTKVDGKTVSEIITGLGNTPICTLDTLKVSNITSEGPTKTINGGQYSNPLIKFGKSARLEMQDALGSSIALECFNGALNEWTGTAASGFNDNSFPSVGLSAVHYGSDFCSPKTLIGETFFIDKVTGKQVKVKIIFYKFLPDSVFNLTQDAAGDASVFDMNGDLLMVDIKVPDKSGSTTTEHGLFYSIVAGE